MYSRKNVGCSSSVKDKERSKSSAVIRDESDEIVVQYRHVEFSLRILKLIRADCKSSITRAMICLVSKIARRSAHSVTLRFRELLPPGSLLLCQTWRGSNTTPSIRELHTTFPGMSLLNWNCWKLPESPSILRPKRQKMFVKLNRELRRNIVKWYLLFVLLVLCSSWNH